MHGLSLKNIYPANAGISSASPKLAETYSTVALTSGETRGEVEESEATCT